MTTTRNGDEMTKIGDKATVIVDDKAYTGIVYHLWGSDDGSASLCTPSGIYAGGPMVKWIEDGWYKV